MRNGSFRPNSSRSRAWSSSDVSTPVIWLIGSPTKRNSEKARKATASITKTDCTSRFTMNPTIALPFYAQFTVTQRSMKKLSGRCTTSTLSFIAQISGSV